MNSEEFKYFFSRSIRMLIVSAAIMLSGCNSTSADKQEPEIVGIEVTPTNHTIVKGGTKQFTALAVTSNGDKIPFGELDHSVWVWEWFTTNSQIATFDNTGLATGLKVGHTICWITLNNSNTESSSNNILNEEPLLKTSANFEHPRIQRMRFTGRDSFGVQVVTASEIKATYNLQ